MRHQIKATVKIVNYTDIEMKYIETGNISGKFDGPEEEDKFKELIKENDTPAEATFYHKLKSKKGLIEQLIIYEIGDIYLTFAIYREYKDFTKIYELRQITFVNSNDPSTKNPCLEIFNDHQYDPHDKIDRFNIGEGKRIQVEANLASSKWNFIITEVTRIENNTNPHS